MNKKLIGLWNEAERHRVDYALRSTTPASAESFGYWKGRRDEAGHFRDKIEMLIKEVEEIEIPVERLEVLE